MLLQTLGGFHLPPIKSDSWTVDGAFQDSYGTADELDGVEPTMGTAAFLMDEASITVTHQITPSYMKNPGPIGASYALDEGGVDSALFDFSLNVLQPGKKTLTAVPNPGTSPDGSLYGIGGTITSWTASVWAAKNYAIRRNPGGAMVLAEIDVTYIFPTPEWVVTFSGGATYTLPLY